MDTDGTTSRYSDIKYSARGWRYCYRKKAEWITYGLLLLLYILILALFITVFFGSSAYSTSQTVSKAELDNFNKTVTELTTWMNQLEAAAKGASCEPGWLQFDGSCYFLYIVKADWHKARNVCITEKADLAVITSEREQIFLTTKSDPNSVRFFWIGLYDSTKNRVWEWVDGTNYEASYKSWRKGQPNNHYGKEECVHLWIGGEWNDARCTSDQRYAICEKKL